MPHTQCHSSDRLRSNDQQEITSKPNLKSDLAAYETGDKDAIKKYHFTVDEVAIMRRQYESNVPITMIGEQWGIKKGSVSYLIFSLFRKHDPSFETHNERRRKVKKWCAWCGKDLPPFTRRKYCSDPECKAEHSPPSTRIHCACGNKKSWRNAKCSDCHFKLMEAKKVEKLHIVRYMAMGGYSTAQIAKKVKLSADRVRIYRQELGMQTDRRRGSWRPEQAEYWKTKVIEASSVKAVYEKSGLTYQAFSGRLRRAGFQVSNGIEQRSA